MILMPGEAQAKRPGHIALFDNFSDLYRHDADGSMMRADVLVWPGALATRQICSFFDRSEWPLELLSSLILPEDEDWLFAHSDDADQSRPRPGLTESDLSRIAKAAGVEQAPCGNFRCTWWIRRYDQTDEHSGSIAYFQSVQQRLQPGPSLGRALIERLIDVLTAAHTNGGDLLVEQLTLIVAKDEARPLRTLTPRLHADEYYGARETAISSICETGWSRQGGALFLPTCRMSDFAGVGPIDMKRLRAGVTSEPVMGSDSGDLLIYDGMRMADGTVDRGQGVPHISSDVLGESARLVVLMRHRPPVDQK